MNIFEALRQSHDVQRELGEKILQTQGDSPERRELYKSYKDELAAHATAEERHFYVPLLADDRGVDLSRHAIAEHHEMDEIIEALDGTEFSSSGWLNRARKLVDTVAHHLKEEEQRFFQMAGKILDDKQKEALAKDYLKEFQSLKES